MCVERVGDDLPIVVRMLRIWSAARESATGPMPPMHRALGPGVSAPEFVPACASLFALTESVLGRPLVPEHRCSAALSRDERAVLWLLESAPVAGQVRTGHAVPHGLPGALRWAAFAVTRALCDGWPVARIDPPPLVACPFDAPAPIHA